MKGFLISKLVLSLVTFLLLIASVAVAISGSILHIYAAGPSNGAWTVAGSMAEGRTKHTLTLLQDGRVLVAEGGETDTSNLISTVEIYDPTTKAWSQTSNLLLPRGTYTKNLQTLQNGKVLLAAGQDINQNSIAESELYDPKTEIWTTTGSLNEPRRAAAFMELNDGRVLAVSGSGNSRFLTSSELYDPTSGTWSYTVGNLSTGRELAGIVKLQDGRVLIAGGHESGDTLGNTAELFDPATSTWSSAGTMPYAWGEGASLTLLSDGRVFMAGGSGVGQVLANTAIYDPSSNTWTATAPLPEPRVVQSAFLLNDGRVLIAGGSNSTGVLISSVIYDPQTDSYSSGPNLNSPHSDYANSISLLDGSVLIVGGRTGGDPSQAVNISASAEVYAVSTNVAPTISSISNATINEGDTYSATGSFTDSDSSSWTATVDYGDGGGAEPLTLLGTNFALNHVYQDEGTYTVTVSVTDNQGATGTGTATVTSHNAPYSIGAITVPNPVVQVNSSLSTSASFTDPGIIDTHTASWNWGDGSTTTGTVTESNGSGSVSGSHIYTASGVYTVTLTVTDDDGVSTASSFQYVSIYNPTAQGLFSAGEKYTSPTGAYTQNPNLTGTVKFGLSYKYQGTVPVGDKEFSLNFSAANFQFSATSVSSLVITNGIGTLRGTGTVNGAGTYSFLVTGSESANTIRIQMKDASGNVVYDTQPGAADTATPTTSVTGHVLAH